MYDFASVNGKVAIVTGGTAGIGKGIASVFAQNGMKVLISGSREERGRKAEAEMRAKGLDVTFVQADVRKEEDIQALIDVAVKQYGTLHVMVNNAGVTQSGHHPLHDFDVSEFDNINAVNFRATFLGTKYAVLAMMDTGVKHGSIINIASTSGLHSSESFSLYDSSKHAVIGLTKSAALDYAQHDITVNAICPGVVETEIYAGFTKEAYEYCKNLNPIGRMGQSEEIGYMALFLASDLAKFVTGAILPVDGGLSAGETVDVTEWIHKDPRM